MNEETKEILIQIQIDNIVKALGGTVSYQSTLDHTGRSTKRIIIEYDEQTGS